MRRRFFTFAAGASAVLCVGIVVVWVRSYWVGDVVRVPYSFKRSYYDSQLRSWYVWVYYIASSRGRLQFTQLEQRPELGSRVTWFQPADEARLRRAHGRPLNRDPADWQVALDEERRWLGFAWQQNSASRGDCAVVVPHWSVCLATAGLPLFAVFSRGRQRAGRRTGRCPACGYDLRATPDRCPEMFSLL